MRAEDLDPLLSSLLELTLTRTSISN